MPPCRLVSQATVAYDHRFRRLEYQGRAGRVKTVVGVDEEPRIKCRLGTVVGVLPQAVVERNGQAGALLPCEQCSLVPFILPAVPLMQIREALTLRVSLMISLSYSVSPLWCTLMSPHSST